MTDDQWRQVMGYYAALWPTSTLTPATGQAWQSVLGGHDQPTLIRALRDLAAEPGRVFGPAAGEIAAAIRQAQRPPPPLFTAQLPAVTGGEARNSRRARVLTKMHDDALDPAGDPAGPAWDDDADLWADADDPLIGEMRRAFLAERGRYPTLAQLADARRTRTRPLAEVDPGEVA